MIKDQTEHDPFTVLDLSEDADDDAIQRRYLALVRRFPPEQAPVRFQEIRTAYEAIRDKRARVRRRLLGPHGAALARLRRACLAAAAEPGRPSTATVRALLREGAGEDWAASILPPETS